MGRRQYGGIELQKRVPFPRSTQAHSGPLSNPGAAHRQEDEKAKARNPQAFMLPSLTAIG
jgi:hypothetical protein